MRVIFDYHDKRSEITNEQDIKQHYVRYEPTIKFDADKNKLYTLMLYDFDAPPSKKSGKEWLHWLVINISDNVRDGKVIVKFHPPTPPEGSGKHRYYVELFEQLNKLNLDNEKTLLNERWNFDQKEFIEKYGLSRTDKIMFTTEYEQRQQTGGRSVDIKADGKQFVEHIESILNKIYKFKDKPILYGGLALQYYDVRKGNNYDFIVSERDHRALRNKYDNVSNIGRVWVDLSGGVNVFAKLYDYDYSYLIKKAKKLKKFYVIGLEDLLIIKCMTMYDREVDKHHREKSGKDIKLISHVLVEESDGWKDKYKNEIDDRKLIDYVNQE